jgi:hypothetical protein
MSTDAITQLTKQTQGLLIPPEYVDVTKEKVQSMKLKGYVLIGMAVLVFAAWSWLLYQSLTQTDFGLGTHFWILAAAGMAGLALYAVFYFAQALSADDLSKEKEADSTWQRVKAFFSSAAAEESQLRKEYFEARKRFLITLNWVLNLTLVFSVVSLAMVIHVLWNPLQYLPQMPSIPLPRVQVQWDPKGDTSAKPMQARRNRK